MKQVFEERLSTIFYAAGYLVTSDRELTIRFGKVEVADVFEKNQFVRMVRAKTCEGFRKE